ncbi:excisionase family DNA-binding protein [Pseudonocardia sp. KRD-169]|uniref:Excisionase family DNA-binding protein n=1 Tax=Pseudonocardia abyssalis TaxID=2792008 RepID=A0ABS6UXM1_9PSEU|nr:excisionase family DNA-binding protein [Pseudonocardia abyssalis]MBW0136996.1 excisionase family DNA-binding protein [Pseudonocardia abyssalis]
MEGRLRRRPAPGRRTAGEPFGNRGGSVITTDQARPFRLVLTVEEAAERLGIGRTLMYALVAAGEVESVRIGRLRRIPTDALDSYVSTLRRLGGAA